MRIAAIGAVLAALVHIAPLRDRTLALLAGGRYLDQRGVVRQHDADDCGVAALAMLLADTPLDPRTLDSLRAVIRARRRGLSMLELQQVAANRGLEARGLRLPYTDLSRFSSPIIAHFREHYVVIDRVSDPTSDAGIFVRDPAIGRLWMPRTSFERRWTGHVLVIAAAPTSHPR